MLIWILIGIIQGLFEWIPVSSSGILMILLVSFGVNPAKAYEYSLIIHIGTLLSLLIALKEDFIILINQLINLLKHGILDRELKLLIIASISSAIIGLPLYYTYKVMISELTLIQIKIIISLLLFLTAIISLFLVRNGSRDLNFNHALIVGLLQGLSIIPGLSRSGLTITGLLALGVKCDLAFKWSFIISGPAILGLILLNILKGLPIFSFEIFIALLSAFIVGLISIKFMLEISKRINRSIIMITTAILILISTIIDLIIIL